MEIETKEDNGVARHCAYCLNLCGLPTKLCGGCKKRAYCSKECQAKDWSMKGVGQRHKLWCGRHECGEEDVDWEVVLIPNKGLGIRAKKLLPAGSKIIVEPTFSSPSGHPGIEDLGPNYISVENRIFFNSFLGENFKGPISVALRIARVNHACQPNAAVIYDETARVGILFAQKDIQPGEEITICYYAPFFKLGIDERYPGAHPDWSMEEEFIFAKEKILFSIHGITCPADCVCNNPSFRRQLCETRKIYATIIELARQYKTKEALDAGEKLLDVYRRLKILWVYQGFTDYNLFRIAIMRSETLPRAKQYIQSAFELFRKICPYSEELTKSMEKLLDHPETEPDYLLVDKMGF